MAATRTPALADTLAPLPRERAQILPCLLAAHDALGFLTGDAVRAVARHTHVPESVVYGVAKSYGELRWAPRDPRAVAVCTGLSCLLNGAAEVARDVAARGGVVEEHPCRFRCNDAPVSVAVDATDAPRATPPAMSGEVRRVLARCGSIDPANIDAAIASHAYEGLRIARALDPESIVRVVEESGLLGRGGAYFPAARKWQTARSHLGPRYLVVNAEEGEPGVFKDRHVIENDPHLLVEGMLIAARAVEAAAVYVYINGEADAARRRFEAALSQARERGFVPDGLPIEVRRGAGGYVCGEESVILNSIEGERAVPRPRPPLPVQAGLWGRPTVINNVETLCNLPRILREGASLFRATGTEAHPGTKVLCVSGAVARPGVCEVPFGTTLRHVVEVIAGGAAPGRTLRAALCGGPSGGLLPPHLWDVPLAPGRLDDGGASLGAGGIVVIDDAMPIADVVRHLTAYNARESCGKCTPCREGTVRMVEILDERPKDAAARLDALSEAIAAASLCGLGQMAPLPYLSARRHFPGEIRRDGARDAAPPLPRSSITPSPLCGEGDGGRGEALPGASR